MMEKQVQTHEEQSKRYSVGIVGGAGYTAGELLRILLHHPNADIAFVHSTSNANAAISDVHQDLISETSLTFSAEISQLVDVLFLCMGHGESKTFLTNNRIHESTKIVDLSQDFRLRPLQDPELNAFVYGLPELNREKIKQSQFVANPGCFATAIQLALLPLAKAGLLNNIYTTGITGSTGAGQALSATSHFSWRANNIQAYKTLHHQHVAEIEESLQSLQDTYRAGQLQFVPWRGDFTRGIFTSSTILCDYSIEKINELFQEYYNNEPFVHVSSQPIHLKQVVNTNKAILHVEQGNKHIVVHSVIDNLLKGAAGQAVQNMNIMCNLPETTGLHLKATGF